MDQRRAVGSSRSRPVGDRGQPARPTAWDTTTGDLDITIAVLDTGVDDRANLGDRRLNGISFVDGDPTVDPTGHGSWVAALAAASHDQTGIAGACPKCTILPVQVGDASGRVPWSAAAEGITWAVDQGADVINLSFGSGSRSETLADAVAYAVANDVVVIGAAGTKEQPPRSIPQHSMVSSRSPPTTPATGPTPGATTEPGSIWPPQAVRSVPRPTARPPSAVRALPLLSSLGSSD